MNRMPAYKLLIERIATWARSQEDIRTVLILGSRARTVDHPADEWSDLDLTLFVTDPERFLSTSGWVEEIGNPWLTFLESTADGKGMERRVLFEGGLDVDFALFPVASIRKMVETGIPPDAADTLRHGMEVLMDKDGLMQQLKVPLSGSQPPRPPTRSEFLELVSDFWYHAVWTAKKLRRGELWTAKFCSDSYMKRQLLRMVEWHARATNDVDCEIWYGGRFLEQWANRRVVEDLRKAFSYYDADDLWRGLFETMKLFRRLAIETAERLDFAYPTLADEHVAEFVQKIFAERG